ncbi:MAG: carboxypeptidase-like regulatory domain-containing protein [Luteibaculaceae bacterium]
MPTTKEFNCCSFWFAHRRAFFIVFSFFFLSVTNLFAQKEISLSGNVKDAISRETLIGATVQIKGTSIGTTADFDGNFTLKTKEALPLILVVSFMGYESKEVTVTSETQKINVQLGTSAVALKEAEVVSSRISEKTMQAPLTVESMDVIAIKEAPSGNFYESLGNLKGVDMVSAAMGFRIINTRGFNSTSPVRSLQLIDGVDNMSPGLNFSLGNFLGASDFDVKRVDIIAGASSAYYGAGAFNGVVSMETKDPFLFSGLDVSAKVGERSLVETGVRWADYFTNKEGKKKFGYKINVFYMQAQDWEANNFDAATDSRDPVGNFGGWDAVNIYGDEVLTGGNNFTQSFNDVFLRYPGLGRIYRTGYREVDLVDYDTRNFKFNTGLYYNITDKVQVDYNFNYANGTTVYQGDNRISLRDVQFYQQKLQVGEKDKWFIRGYHTWEDAGNSYDAVATAFRLLDRNFARADLAESSWYTVYRDFWENNWQTALTGLPWLPQNGAPRPTQAQFSSLFPGDANSALAARSFELLNWFGNVDGFRQEWFNQNPDILARLHNRARGEADRVLGYLEPGSPEFQAAFDDITSRTFREGGTRFFDRSQLFHVHGEYKFTPEFMKEKELEFTVGGNVRWYRPNTQGNIMSDTLSTTGFIFDDAGNIIDSTTVWNRITNYEFGAYAGFSFLATPLLRVSGTLRLDKNENFDPVLSPALSAVYSKSEKTVYRLTFSSAVRNPTLFDQFLFYDVGRAILIGNLNGFNNLNTLESFDAARNDRNTPGFAWSLLESFDVPPIRPETVRTIEGGFRTTFFDKVFVDFGFYNSWYNNFIGFVIGLDVEGPVGTTLPPTAVQAYRVSANAQDMVTTRGADIGINYYFYKTYALTANYSWNRLDLRGSDDPIIPAFNTPEHKFNVGANARELKTLPSLREIGITQYGFGVNYRWVEGFIFEGSPQFTGFIPTYDMVDAQINFTIPSWKTVIKMGASNVLNNQVFTVYGGPRVGRLAYIQAVMSLDRKDIKKVRN